MEKKRRWLGDLLFLAVVLLGKASFADHYYVPSESMQPTLQVGDRLFVDKRAYGLRLPLSHVWLTETEPQRGDVVVFDSPYQDLVMVKRLVGLPGDVLAFDGQNLFVNGVRVEQTLSSFTRTELLPGRAHPLGATTDQGPAQPPLVIPPGHLFVMGDNRGNSADSRFWGLVSRDRLLGRATHVLYSGRGQLPLSQRWLIPLGGSAEGFDPRLAQ